jgi:hypothetical protein
MCRIVAHGSKVQQIIGIPSLSAGAVARSDTVLALTIKSICATQAVVFQDACGQTPPAAFAPDHFDKTLI